MMIKRKFWWQWVLMSALGWVLSWIALFLIEAYFIPLLGEIISLIEPEPEPLSDILRGKVIDTSYGVILGGRTAFVYGAFFGMISGIVFGAVGGTAQALVLRSYLPKPYWWIWANALLWATCFGFIGGRRWEWSWSVVLINLAIWGSGKVITYEFLGAIGLGCLQWLILRKRIAKAYLWILTVIVNWLMMRLVAERIVRPILIQSKLEFFQILPSFCSWLVVGIFHGVLTGVVLSCLLRASRRSEHCGEPTKLDR
jgi:uncharacterized membrane-anchored protein YitT (DUF2179 family)